MFSLGEVLVRVCFDLERFFPLLKAEGRPEMTSGPFACFSRFTSLLPSSVRCSKALSPPGKRSSG